MNHTNVNDWTSIPRERRWHQVSAWSGMLLLAWLVFEQTADPVAGDVVGCAKFGWNDVPTLAPRGKTCFWFYIASALWKVSVTATIASAMTLGMILLAVTILAIKDWVQRHLVAATPQECWPEEQES